MVQGRCFRFAYTMPCHKDREHLPFQLRDGDAAAFLMGALIERGYRYGGLIINYPSKGPDLIPFDDSFLAETDLILLTTRPPMNDGDLGERKGIPRSFTTLEDKLFAGPLRERFKKCARSEILLSNATAGISAEIAKRQAIEFRQNGGAMYQSYGSPITRQWRRFKHLHSLTAAFLLFTEHAWPGGPALLAAFGMGGTETLVWCYQLATRFPHLLCKTGFAMAEMQTSPVTERPASMDFADSWEITILGAEEPAPLRGPNRAA
jgi:hypothetical protein